LNKENVQLEVNSLYVSYGGIEALRDVSIYLKEGELVTLIGANGAGKSSLLNAISGVVKIKKGGITFEGRELTRMKPHEIVRLGINQVPEGRRIFSRLTVKENLRMGAYIRTEKEIRQDLSRVYTLFPRLKEREGQIAGTLSGGEQQMLAMARALMARPKLMLLDEPSMGLAPILVDLIFDTIKKINREKTGILLVEQNALMALKVAERCYVLQSGVVQLEGPSHRLRDMEEVRKIYLGFD